MERHNPVNPKAEMRTGVYGGRATPSRGLSQFRGGSRGSRSSSESDEELEGGGNEMVGAGTGGMSEATQMGLHLGKHLHKLHGGGLFAITQPVRAYSPVPN